jgi:hypothetical protein
MDKSKDFKRDPDPRSYGRRVKLLLPTGGFLKRGVDAAVGLLRAAGSC